MTKAKRKTAPSLIPWETIGVGLFVVAVLWVMLATVVFSFRHPQATNMQKLFHFGDILTFSKVETLTGDE